MNPAAPSAATESRSDPTAGAEATPRVAHFAATLFERLARSEGGPEPEDVDHDAVAATLERWARLYARGDQQALRRRLAWDGIDEGRLARALTRSDEDALAPAEWMAWLPRVLAEAGRCADELRARGGLNGLPGVDGEEPPFAELWVPFVRVAQRELAARASARLEWLLPPARLAFEAHLTHGLAGVGELALLDTFRRDGADWWQSGGDAYAAFIQLMLAGGLATVCDEFPVLARQWIGLLETWVTTGDEMLARLDRDHDEIRETFGAPKLGRVAHAEPGLSDRHHGGRRVACLRFESGLRLLYKPRSLAIEAAWNDFLGWCAAEGLPDAPPTMRLLGRADYGWVEHVAQATLRDDADVERYFRTAGALIALTYVLGARDLHGENVVAASGGPVLVDAEMLLTPRRPGEPGASSVPEGGRLADADAQAESCLATGLLTDVHLDDAGEASDLGGLQASPRRATPVPQRTWQHLRTSQIGYTRVAVVQRDLANQPVLAGQALGTEGQGVALRTGFEAAYRFLLECRAELLEADGPLVAFGRAATRLLFRPSGQYGALLYVTCAPAYQRDGVLWSVALDSLNSVFSIEEERPRLWPLTVQEREALEHLDIPRLTVPAGETAITAADGTRVEDVLVEDGLSAARRRLSGLGESDLARQLLRLDDALEAPFMGADLSSGGDSSSEEASALLGAARLLAHAMLRRAEHTRDGLTWPAMDGRLDLYGGATGTALFLAAIGATASDPDCSRAAAQALAPVREALRDERDWHRGALGAGEGLGSIAYGLAVIAQLRGENEWLDGALTAAHQITEDRISSDEALDVEGGTAGAILGLLALYEIVGGADWLLEKARLCGDRLLATQRLTGPEAGGWPGPDGRIRAGFAHGCAGVAYALMRLHKLLPDPRLPEAALRAVRHERGMFSAASGNWPALGLRVGSRLMVAWCHGAPGIALARASLRASLPDPAIDEEIEVAIRTTRTARPNEHDHLCCGNLGRADVLLTVGRRLGRPEWAEDAASFSRHVAERVLREGRHGARTPGYKTRELDPSFFQGLSGIGYELLRVGSPEPLPSVLAFDARGEESR